MPVGAQQTGDGRRTQQDKSELTHLRQIESCSDRGRAADADSED